MDRYSFDVGLSHPLLHAGLSRRSKTDKIDARVPAELSVRDLVPAIWLPPPGLRRERERSRWRLHLVKHRSILKHRVHSTLIAFGYQVPMADLFGVAGRTLWPGSPSRSRGAGTSRPALS